ncbi:AraC family transcriptional regulator [Maricurvus nonylphenolicus]|uniref:AraC family transcriptional regulator ligand-binding domain-containing protein n=1 Tax=Maricurvus nonylphenolicus TaxID=1008307 RepID=UPI0036F26E17
MRQQQTQSQKPDIRRFHQEFQRLSIDTTDIYKQLNISDDVVEADNGSISMIKYYELMELAAETSNRPYLGIEMGLACQTSDLGMLGYMLRNAPTFERALELLHNYIVILTPEASTSLIEESDNCILTYQISNSSPEKTRQSMEMTITQYILMIRHILQDDHWQPERIYFEHSQPPAEVLKDFPLGGEVIFDHFFSGVSFPKDLMQYANNDFDPKLLELLENQVLQTLKDHIVSDSLLDHIRLLISSNLGNTEITADNVASELGMSRRTMHRRLSENGTTFNALREEIVLHIAKESLSKTSASITELAHKLGYADSSAFDRAFKRLTGSKPLEYRKQHSPH